MSILVAEGHMETRQFRNETLSPTASDFCVSS